MTNMIPEIKGSSDPDEGQCLRRISLFWCEGLAKLANIASHTLLFVSVSLAMDNQRTLLFGQEQ